MSQSIDQLTRGVRRPTGAAALTLFLVLGASASTSAAEPDLERSCARYASDGVRVAECVEELRIARDATAKYRDPAVALRDGFVQTDDCHDAAHAGEDPALGAAGEHWVRVDRMADERLDPREPEILLYINTPRGRRLVAVEWAVQRIVRGPPLVGGLPHFGTEPPDPSRTTPPPKMFGGKAFDGPMQGHHPHQPWHYDLHVWLWEENPAGVFAPFNRRVSCEDGLGEGGAHENHEAGPQSAARSPAARLRLSVLPQRTRAGRRTRFRFRVTTRDPGSPRAVAGAVVQLADRTAATDRRGRAVIVKELRRPGRYRARAVKRGMTTGRASVRVSP